MTKPQPIEIENERVLSGHSYNFFWFLSALFAFSVVFLFSQLVSSAALPKDLWAVVFLLLAVMLISNPMVRWFLLLKMKRPLRRGPRSGSSVAVVTTYVPGLEPLAMLERTLRAMVGITYRHDTWVLDEGDSPEVRKLCETLKVNHFSRKGRSEYQTDSGTFERATKHGNYNAWLWSVGFERYEFIVSFDPDHVPEPNFLEEVLGYFDDPKVGYVQAAQAYYNQDVSFVAAGAAAETYDYNSTIQMASYGLGYPIIMGCHNSHRGVALREVGGFAAHDADDLLITIRYRKAGWEGVYVPLILARGLTPVDWRGYLIQQRRWARSVLDIKFGGSNQFGSALPLRTRMMSYLHGLNYLQPTLMFAGSLYLLLACLSRGYLPFIATNMQLVSVLLMVITLTTCHFFRQQFYLDPKTEFGLHLRARILRLAKAPFLLLAFLDVIRGNKPKYEVTSKVRNHRGSRMLLPIFGPAAILILIAWYRGMRAAQVYPIGLHLAAVVTVLLCLGLILSEFTADPEPYDDSVHVRARRSDKV